MPLDCNSVKTLTGGAVHTLAQNGTTKTPKSRKKPMVIVNGNGADFSNDEKIFARAKRKIITQKLVLNLIDVARQKKMPKAKTSIGTPITALTKPLPTAKDYTEIIVRTGFVPFVAETEKQN